jgi:putative ABC transport system ATP-binding protein
MIRLENVIKCYGKRCVLQGINLQVAKGDFISVMGRSGSGKSTLLNMIGGMDIPDSGKIIADGEDVSSYTEEQLTLYRRDKIGFIFQFFNLFPNMTVSENIEMPLLLKDSSDYEDRIEKIVRMVGLEGKEHDIPFQLSGGEQQRVAIARALVHEPAIILADEPTGNLDTTTGTTIMELIRDIARHDKKTVILATHDLSISQYANSVLTIKDGVILQ